MKPQCCYRLVVTPVQITKRDIYDFTAKHKLGVLGTTGPENRPQSSLVGIAVTPGLDIIFDTVKTSRKYRNLIVRSDCSFAIGWDGEQTAQYEGKATELGGSDLDRLQGIYFATWPECRAHLSWPNIVYFVVRPHWIRYSDFDQVATDKGVQRFQVARPRNHVLHDAGVTVRIGRWSFHKRGPGANSAAIRRVASVAWMFLMKPTTLCVAEMSCFHRWTGAGSPSRSSNSHHSMWGDPVESHFTTTV